MANLITIEQLLESVDLDFEPRFVTRDNAGEIWVWDRKPRCSKYLEEWSSSNHCSWEELIRTRKALDVAVDALKTAQQYICSDKKSYQIIQTAIEQITALTKGGSNE